MEKTKRKLLVLSFVMMFILVAAILFYTVFILGDKTIADATLVKNCVAYGLG